jgi:hypothetical protein
MSNQRPPRPGREPFRLLKTKDQREPVQVVEPVVRWPSQEPKASDSDEHLIEDLDDVEPMTTDDRIEAVEQRLGEVETKQDLTRKEVAMNTVALTAVAGRLDEALSKSKMSGATAAVAGTSTVGLIVSVVVDNKDSILVLARAIKSIFTGH